MKLLDLVRRETQVSWRALLTMIMLSGFANTLLLVLINRGAEQVAAGSFEVQLIVLYLLGFGIFVQAQYVAMTRAVATVEAAMQRRQGRIAEKIRQTPWLGIEQTQGLDVIAILAETAEAVAPGARLLITMMQSLLLLAAASLYMLILSPASLVLILLGYAALIPLSIAHWRRTRREWPVIDQTETTLIHQFDTLIASLPEREGDAGQHEALFAALRTTAHTAYRLKRAAHLRHMRDLVLRRSISYGLLFVAVFIVPALTTEPPDVILKITTTVLFIAAPLTVVLDLLPRLVRMELGLGSLDDLEARLDLCRK